ncbi:hypothetical protein [Saccharopolyspora cebuensis]|uniref:Uncharacterized protein n=1 Tax=Saccharopolyspora cebuensis TaxID=418759 RepID=A0ABV4CSE5_9PSEU
MESPSRAPSALDRRGVLRLLAAVPLVAVGAAACGSGSDAPDPLIPVARAAKADAALAAAVARAHPDLSAAAAEVETARGAHAEALRREVDRLDPPDPDAPPSVPDPGPVRPPADASAAAEALRTAVDGARTRAAELVPGAEPYRAGLLASVSASCASLLEVLG